MLPRGELCIGQNPEQIIAARFPAGLAQPPGGYRFGADALLLAAWGLKNIPSNRASFQAVDLGTGCGAALIALALVNPAIRGAGIDICPQYIACARENAANLGLADRLRFIRADLADKRACVSGAFQLALANPPWLAPGAGREPKSELRRAALCQKPDTLSVFCRAASRLLAYHGMFCAILPPALLCEFCASLSTARLGLRAILPVASRAGEPALRLLILARKEAASRPEVLPPLCLHEKSGFSQAALEFCPPLGNIPPHGFHS